MQRCSNCGAEADSGQLVCLECGGRLGLDYRRPGGSGRALAVVLLVLIAAGVAFALTLSSVDDDAEQEIAATPASKATGGGSSKATTEKATTEKTKSEKAKSAPKQKSSASERAKARRERAAARRRAARRRAEERASTGGGIGAWPRRRNGFMVVLLSTQDRGGAGDFARSRRKDGVDGVLRADDYPSLSSSAGFYIVFAGPYPSRRRAEQAAGRLQKRFQGVFVQYVNGAKAK